MISDEMFKLDAASVDAILNIPEDTQKEIQKIVYRHSQLSTLGTRIHIRSLRDALNSTKRTPAPTGERWRTSELKVLIHIFFSLTKAKKYEFIQDKKGLLNKVKRNIPLTVINLTAEEIYKVLANEGVILASNDTPSEGAKDLLAEIDTPKRNPPWSRDELILALHLYLNFAPNIPSQSSPEISQLSNDLSLLNRKLGNNHGDTYRNINGVHMKLMNFKRLDPEYDGTGLTRGNKDELVVWDAYKDNKEKLNEIAKNIYSFIHSNISVPLHPIEDSEPESEEGKVLTRVHQYRERNTKIIQKKKDAFIRENGSLFCEACGFNFSKFYGDRGEGFIECHHIKPVSELVAGDKTKLSDLILLCSNCHRIVHRKKPWLKVKELIALISSK